MSVTFEADLRNLNALYKNIRNEVFKTLPNKLEKQIISDINRGVSPVKGNRFPKYSVSYKNAIKKGRYPGKSIAPVNLTLTGKMLKSLKLKLKDNLSVMTISVMFSDKKAKYHDIEGAGKSKVIRRMLPKSGEEFNARTMKLIRDEIKKAIRKFTS